jgi:MFS family permease
MTAPTRTYAYGWSPVRAGLANLPLIITMLLATPLSEWLAGRFGHRVACLVGAGFLAGALAGLSWGVDHGYPAIAVCMVAMTIGLRTVMTICAIALVEAMPSNRTSMGTALNDTAQEVGTSVGTALVGTFIVGLVAGGGALTLTDSHSTQELSEVMEEQVPQGS